MNKSEIISGLEKLGVYLATESDELKAAVDKACYENQWFSEESCNQSLNYWSTELSDPALNEFSKDYKWNDWSKTVVVIMAGNIPLVGMHDLMVSLLCGCKCRIKTSSEDNALVSHVIDKLIQFLPELGSHIELIDKLEGKQDAVIATGSNNSYRYFQYYFKDTPHVLRKNRKSIAVLNGNESEEELKELAHDIFEYYGLGCRNVSLIALPKGSDITKVIDAFGSYNHLIHHNRYANNYTYHKALFLMNKQDHLDNGFVLLKESLDLFAPLGCVFYCYYNQLSDIEEFVEKEAENIQCVVGKIDNLCNVQFGHSQRPNLQDFADDINTMRFLSEL
ncbi:MAG: acyl-CoA reductase [Bacteroidia bacterium]